MSSQRHSYGEVDIACRLRRDRRFALEYAERALGHGRPEDLQLACARFALAFTDPQLLADSFRPDDARIILERIESALELDLIDLESMG